MNADLVQHLADLGVDLDDLTPDDILTTAQAARLAGVTPQCINNWRKRGYGPKTARAKLRNIGTEDRPRFLRMDVALAERATRRRGVLREAVDVAAWQIDEHWTRINPDAA